MTAYLADSNVLLRLYQKTSPHYGIARMAVRKLRQSGDVIYIVPQNIVEFWSVASRPASANGLGYSATVTDRIIRQLEGIFTFEPDQPPIHDEWRRLVVSHTVTGRQVHDARLVAAMLVHGISNILTFNLADFRRYSAINAVAPASVR